MARRLPMSDKERTRSKVLEMVQQGKMTLKAAVKMLRVSYRQGIRLYAAYRLEGDNGLIHGNCQRQSNNRTPEAILKAALEAYRTRYSGFGPTFAAEKMAEVEGIPISVSVLRRHLIAAGEWRGCRLTKEYRSRRERKAHFGELVQFDGSHHRWFEDRGPICCLITMIDDATNIRLSRFFEAETTAGAMSVFSLWIRKYGIPEALYCDKKNAFVLTREPTDAELLRGITEPKSHFGRACEKLGTQVIAAHSPQAKGRVERNHGVDQDRLIKELRLAGISTIAEANRFLEEYYLPKMNTKFSRPSAKPENAHVPLGNANMEAIMCFEYERTVDNSYVIRFENRLFQILKSKKPLPRPKDKVTIRISLDGKLIILWHRNKLLVKEITNIQDLETQKAA
ncbi:MAG: ISNCY family transposase [Treponema sp.]|nr:ISNCY family transposase [Treponema sp.]